MLSQGAIWRRYGKKFTFSAAGVQFFRNFSWFVYKLFTIKCGFSGILMAQRMLVLRSAGAQAATSSGSDSYFSSSPLSLSENARRRPCGGPFHFLWKL